MNKWDRVIGRVMLGALLVALVAGCSQIRDVDRLQAFLQKERSPVSGKEYRVLPPDVLAIHSRYVREINGVRQQIRPDGRINMPLVGEIFVAGLTLSEIAAEVAWAARKYYKRADVTVYVVQYNSQKMYVFGEVGRPGPLPWTGTDTLLDVLARVQPTRLAWPERIKVVRGRKPTKGGYLPGREGGEPKTTAATNKAGAEEITINLMAMIKSGDMSHNILLLPDDIVYVPANPFAAVGLAIQQVVFPLSQALSGVRAARDIRDDVENFNRSRYYVNTND